MVSGIKIDNDKIKIYGDINFDTITTLYKNLKACIVNGKNLLIDFNETTQINSAALALIVELKKDAKNLNATLKFSNIPEKLKALAGISNIDCLLFD